jgi:hypothetical protein
MPKCAECDAEDDDADLFAAERDASADRDDQLTKKNAKQDKQSLSTGSDKKYGKDSRYDDHSFM